VTRARILVVAIAVLVIAGGLAWSLAGGGDDSGGAGSGDAVEVVLAASPEKEPLLAPLVEEINEGALESEGRPVRVDLRIVSSGDATDRIAEGELEPTIWSPSSSLWGRILNFRADREIVPDDAPSLVKTPLVIAMAEPLARALGWPDAEIGWEEIVAEARSEEGWAAYGHPEWGAFKFGQTNPQFSTSGLSATVAEYLVAAGKREGLTLADVERPANRAFVRDIQRSVVHYGDTTLFFAEQMAERGPQYVSAVAMEEVTLLDYNLRLRQGGPKLVAIYPKEGTFFSDNPLIVPQADWVDAERRAAAQVVREFLIERTTPEVAAESYFRPPGDAEPVPPVDAENGVDPAQPTRTLALPQPRVMNAIIRSWLADRKPARVEIVLDVSGSMGEAGKLAAAQNGVSSFLRLLQPQDQVGLSVFSEEAVLVSEPVPIRTGRRELIERVQGLFPEGETALYDAVARGVRRVGASPGDDRIDAVVVLSDGADNASSTGLDALLEELARVSGSEGEEVRVFTIAYGEGAEREVLERIADAGAGRAYEGDPETIEEVYIQISSFF
jgi:Ca-activated chloride channel family protein